MMIRCYPSLKRMIENSWTFIFLSQQNVHFKIRLQNTKNKFNWEAYCWFIIICFLLWFFFFVSKIILLLSIDNRIKQDNKSTRYRWICGTGYIFYFPTKYVTICTIAIFIYFICEWIWMMKIHILSQLTLMHFEFLLFFMNEKFDVFLIVCLYLKLSVLYFVISMIVDNVFFVYIFIFDVLFLFAELFFFLCNCIIGVMEHEKYVYWVFDWKIIYC